MSTPARKSGRQAKPTEKFKEYLYEREVPSKFENNSSITEHIQTSKEKPSTDATIHTTLKKRGRPRKSVMQIDPLKNKTNNPESEDEDKDSTKGSKNKKGPHKKAKFEPQPECNSSTLTDSESEDEVHGGKSQESGPRRSGRPPKLNKRLLSYLHSDEVSKSTPVVQPNTVSIEGHEFKVVSSPDKFIRRNNQKFKILPVAGKVTSVYDFIPSPTKTSKKGLDKENKKLVSIENEPRRSIRTPKTNARLLNFLDSEVTPKKLTSSSENRENSKNTNESSILGHAPPKKSDQEIFKDITSGEASSPEPRRSSRVPKINERLLSYLNREEVSEEREKPVCDSEPRRSSREPKTSEKLYNYLYSTEGKYRKLPVKSQIPSPVLTQQPSFQRINAEIKISPIGDLSPRRSSRAPKTNERLLNYLHAGDRKSKRSSEVSGTDSQTSAIISNIEKKKANQSNSSNNTNEENFSEEDSPIKEPRRSTRTPKTNEKLRNYLQPKEDLEVASTSNGEPMWQKRLLKESPGSGSSFKHLCIKNNSSNEKNIISNHKIKQCSIVLKNIEVEKMYKSQTNVTTSSLESLFKDEPLPIPYNAWLLCLGHHSSQFGYSADTETIAAKVYIENQGLYLGTHQILLNEYKRQLKEYFNNMPKSLRSRYLELRANHIWNCFNEDIFEDIIGSSFITENNMSVVKSSKLDKIQFSSSKLPIDSDSDDINKSNKTPRKRKKRKINSSISKFKKYIYKNESLIESDSSLKEDDNESETSSNKDIDNIYVNQCFSRKSTKRKLSKVFVQQTLKKSLHEK